MKLKPIEREKCPYLELPNDISLFASLSMTIPYAIIAVDNNYQLRVGHWKPIEKVSAIPQEGLRADRAGSTWQLNRALP